MHLQTFLLLFVALNSFFTLLVHALRKPELAQLFDSLSPMQPNAALCFLLLTFATTIGTHARAAKRYVPLAGAALSTCSLLALTTVMQDILNVDFHLDTLILAPAFPTAATAPGRMSPITAALFILSASAVLLILAQSARLTFIASTLLACSLIMSMWAIIAHMLGLQFNVGRDLRLMSPMTSINHLIIASTSLVIVGRQILTSRKFVPLWNAIISLVCGLASISSTWLIMHHVEYSMAAEANQRLMDTLTAAIKHQTSSAIENATRFGNALVLDTHDLSVSSALSSTITPTIIRLARIPLAEISSPCANNSKSYSLDRSSHPLLHSVTKSNSVDKNGAAKEKDKAMVAEKWLCSPPILRVLERARSATAPMMMVPSSGDLQDTSLDKRPLVVAIPQLSTPQTQGELQEPSMIVAELDAATVFAPVMLFAHSALLHFEISIDGQKIFLDSGPETVANQGTDLDLAEGFILFGSKINLLLTPAGSPNMPALSITLNVILGTGILVSLIFSVLVYRYSRIGEILAEKEERLRLATTAPAVGVWDWDIRENKLSWDKSMYNLYGISPQSFSGAYEAWRNSVHPEDQEYADGEVQRALASENELTISFRVIRPDKSVVYIRSMATIIRDGVGDPQRMVGTNWDITQLKLAELRLEERSRELEQALAQLQLFKSAIDRHVIVAITDRAGRITEANKLFSEISGFTEEELKGRTHSIVNSGHHPKAFFQELWRTIANGEVWEGEICNRRKDGEIYWVATTIIPIIDPVSGQIDGYMAARRDITRQRQYEESLIEAKRIAEEVALTKGRFLANMSHEIRTPLTAIIGLSEVLIEGKDPPAEQSYHLQLILRNSKHLLEIINDVLDISKIEANEFTVSSEPTNLPSVIKEAGDLLQHRVEANPNLSFKIKIAPSVPSWILSDPLSLRQILTNLLANAIKFTEEGSITVAASFDVNNSELRIAVMDTGIGIPRREQQRLFKIFTQADPSTRRRYGGTGLGLYISSRLAQMLGGEIEVISDCGIGSTFTLVLRHVVTAAPATGETAPSDLRLNHVASSEPPNATAAPPLEPTRKILVAEDNYSNRLLLEAFLRDVPVVIEFAENGKIALDRILKEHFDLVLMDMQMPVMDGYESTRLMREGGFQGPIIALTANAFREDRELCIGCGCSDFLGKPFRKDLFYSTINKYLEAR